MKYTKNEYIKVPPARPYCWSNSGEFDKSIGPQMCENCGFREECKANIGKIKNKNYLNKFINKV